MSGRRRRNLGRMGVAHAQGRLGTRVRKGASYHCRLSMRWQGRQTGLMNSRTIGLRWLRTTRRLQQRRPPQFAHGQNSPRTRHDLPGFFGDFERSSFSEKVRPDAGIVSMGAFAAFGFFGSRLLCFWLFAIVFPSAAVTAATIAVVFRRCQAARRSGSHVARRNEGAGSPSGAILHSRRQSGLD